MSIRIKCWADCENYKGGGECYCENIVIGKGGQCLSYEENHNRKEDFIPKDGKSMV